MKVPLLRLIAFFVKPYPWFVAGVIATGLGFVLLEAVGTVIVYPTVGSLVKAGSADHVAVSMIQRWLGDLTGEERALRLVCLFGATYLVLTVLNYARTAVSDVFSRLITRDFQNRLFQKYLDADYQYLLDNQQGAILFRLLTAPAHMTVLFASVPKLGVAALKLAVVGGILCLFSVEWTLAIVLLGALFYAGTRVLSDAIVYQNSSRMQQTHEGQTVVGNEAMTGIREIKIRSVEPSWIARFRGQAFELCRLYVRNDLFRSLPSSALQVGFLGALLVGLMWNKDRLGGSLLEYVPLAGVYFYAFMRVAPSLTEMATLKMLVAERRPYAEAVYLELQRPSRRLRDGSLPCLRLSDRIVFDRVFFSYPGREGTLSDISFTVEKGTTTAIVGHSGSGKSTLADLVVRLFDVDQGRILIDGLDLRDLRVADWRRRIGYVSQDTFIVNASVRDNIAFCSPGVSFEAVQAAARAADAHEYIMELPQQYDTLLGDRGLKLSGGQRQRIAIARALIHDPDLLIFDEATSALDSLSELEVQAAIGRLAKDHTVIVVAHRLSTIRRADNIIVLQKGRIVEEGRHEDLLSRRGVYQQLYVTQQDALAGAASEIP